MNWRIIKKKEIMLENATIFRFKVNCQMTHTCIYCLEFGRCGCDEMQVASHTICHFIPDI